MEPRTYLHTTDVARYLGVTKQRVHQLAFGPGSGFPESASRAGVRVWDRAEIERWAERAWWGTKPWRTP